MDLTITDRADLKFGGQARERVHAGAARFESPAPSRASERPIDYVPGDDSGLPQARYAPGNFNWKTFAIVAGIHAAAAGVLLSTGVVGMPRSQSNRLTVIDIRTPPPQAELPARPQPEIASEKAMHDPAPALIEPKVKLSARPFTAIEASSPTPTVSVHVNTPPAAPAPPAPITPPDFSAAQLDNPGPRYPYASRRNREEGTVTLKVLVTPDGYAGDVDIHQSSGFERLDAAAIRTIRKWRFVPARQAGKPIAAWVLVPIGFYLS